MATLTSDKPESVNEAGEHFDVDRDTAQTICRKEGATAIYALMRDGRLDPDVGMDVVNKHVERPVARFWRVLKAIAGG